MIINRLDQTGERTIIDRTATKTDVIEKAQFIQQVTGIQILATNNFSNILVSQADITRIDGILTENNINPDSSAFDDLRDDHDSNAARISILEPVHLANALILDNTFANVTVLQSNVVDITANVIELESNSFATHANVATLQTNVVTIENNIVTIESDVTSINSQISGIANFGDIATLTSDVDELKNRVEGTDFVKIGGGTTGEGTLGSQPTIVGINSGQNIGNYSIAVGYQTQNFGQPNDALNNTIVLNATGAGKNPSRSSATYITPIQEDNANVIAIMGSNTATHEIVTTSLLRLKDSDIQSNTNIKVYTDDFATLKASISNDSGNSSFAGNMQNQGTLAVGGVSSFSGNMSIKDSSFLVKSGTVTKASINKDGTSSFAGVMSVNNDANFDGTVTFKNSGTETANINGTNGTSSFSGAMQVNNNATVDGSFLVASSGATKAQILNDGTSSFSGAMHVNSNVTVDGTFLVKNGGTTKARISDDGTGSFAGGLTIVGSTNIYDDINVYNGNALQFDVDSATGDVTSKGNGSFAGTLKTVGVATFGSNGSFGGTLQAAGVATFGSNGSFGGTLQAAGVATFGSNSSFGGTLKTAGATTLGNTLTVSSNGSFGGTLKTAGVATFGSNGSFGGTLKTAGATTLGSTLTVSSNGSFGGDLKCDGTATLDAVTTSGTGSFGTVNCGGTVTATTFSGSLSGDATGTTGSFGTVNCGGNVTADSFLGNARGTTGSFGTINCGGTITAATDVVVSSDLRLKSNLNIIDSPLDKIQKISGYTYTMDDQRKSGLIAQELIQILPEAVCTKDNGMYAVSYNSVIALLVEAIKELSKKNN